MEETIQKLIDVGVPFILNVIAAIVIYIVGRWIAKIASSLTQKVMEKAKVDEALVKFSTSLVYAGILVFTIIAAVGKLGVQTASFIAVLGAAGLAVGMALQGTLANFAAGVMILLLRPFKIGDFVDAGGNQGSVMEVHIFNTILATPDNRKIIIPNSQITSGTITNFTAVDQRRIDLTFGISYSDNIKTAKEALQRLCSADSRILKNPAVDIAVAELGESSVNIVCRPWVKPSDYWGVLTDLTEKAKAELEKAGCTIPFPQRDVHIFQETADEGNGKKTSTSRI